jgi:hypothetical protein
MFFAAVSKPPVIESISVTGGFDTPSAVASGYSTTEVFYNYV